MIETRLDREAKYNVKYSSSTDYSSDESYGRRPPKHHHIAAISGPTPESIAAHVRQQKEKEKTATDALLELGNARKNSNTGSIPNAAVPSTSGMAENHIDNNRLTHVMPAALSHPEDIGDNKDSDDEPLLSVQSRLKEDAKDNIPLSEMQKRLCENTISNSDGK